ncbi:MAG: cell wall hydrolase [Oscillospiraceae bacterium]
MRKVLSFAIVALLLTGVTARALADFDADTDYSLLMTAAAVAGDAEAGKLAETRRNEKIDTLDSEEKKISYDDLVLLARVIHTEAGSDWLPDKWRMAVGEVLLNRVASPEFPDTLKECAYQPGQYSGVASQWFETLKPYASCAAAAKRLLSGERVLNEPSVVFQSGEEQGSGVFLELSDTVFGSTYFCYTNHPELYEG